MPSSSSCKLQSADPLIEDMYRLARTNTLVEAAEAGSGGEPKGDAAEPVGETKPFSVEGKKRPVKSIPYLFIAPSQRGVFGARAAQLEPCSGPRKC